MAYVALARKYRPQTFADVCGQAVIARTLSNAIRKDRVHHAYLFTGPRGVGKTSSARILAKALCCETGPTPEPCGVCDHCRMIADSVHPDVAEIDAATHNGVDSIRDLGDGAVFAPTQARCKIYILDEVHMLSSGAWNALLKLLEEPPPHVRFIFATTEVEKVLPTVLSRCQRFDFRNIDGQDIVDRLRQVCAGEGIAVDDSILLRIARAAQGGMRDAQTLLDQVLSIAEGSPSHADLDLLLAAARGDLLQQVMRTLAAGDGGTAIGLMERAHAEGVAGETLLGQLLDRYRQLLLVQTCGKEAKAVLRLGPVDDGLLDLAQQLPLEHLLRICQILIGAQQALRGQVDPQLQLELCCIRIAKLGECADLDSLLKQVRRLEQAAGSGSLPP